MVEGQWGGMNPTLMRGLLSAQESSNEPRLNQEDFKQPATRTKNPQYLLSMDGKT